MSRKLVIKKKNATTDRIQLRHNAAGGIVLYEGNNFSNKVITIFTVIALILLLGGAAGFFIDTTTDRFLYAPCMILLGANLMYKFYRIIKRRSIPVMTIYKDAIELPDFKTPIPTEAIKYYTLIRKTWFFIPLAWEVNFFFKTNFKQEFNKKARFQTIYFPKDRQLIIYILGLEQGITAEEFTMLLDQTISIQNQTR